MNLKGSKKASTRKRVKRTASVLACLVAFVTTYMLILPAITMEKDQAAQQLGFPQYNEATVEEGLADGSILQIKDKETGETRLAIVVDQIKGDESTEAVTVIEKDPEKGLQLLEVSLDDPAVTVMSSEQSSEYPELKSEVAGLISAAQEEEILAAEEAATLEGEVENSLAALGVDVKEDSSATPQNDDDVIQSKAKDPEHETVGTNEEDPSVQVPQDDNEVTPQDDKGNDVIQSEAKDYEEENGLDEQISETGISTQLDNDISTAVDQVSTYLLNYTVDFHWDVDGEAFEYSLPGGGFISLTELIKTLGVVGENGPISLESKSFVANVEKVEFSSPELLSISKAEEDTTVGAIKDGLGLVCTYSSDLTKEDIERIDSTSVQAGDWALISVLPFDSTEKLIVTMKTGDQVEIKVTDEQPNNPYGLGGKTFVIVNRKNNQDSALTASVSTQNGNCLAGTNIANMSNAPNSIRWTFDYTGTGKEFLLRDQNGKYLIINEGNISLGTQEEAMANPIVVEYDNTKDRYALKAKNNDQALNNYGMNNSGNQGFGRWPFDANNNDFWMQLRSPESLNKPGTINTADTRSEGITINLFDYGPESLDLKGNTVESLTNEGINSGHDLKFVSFGTLGDSMNHYTGGTNEAGSDGTRYLAMQGIVQPKLSGGFPVLTGYTATNGGSLQYLFDPTTTVNGKTTYGDVNHLFTKDEKGYYQYDSNMNYAYYDTSSANINRDFTVYANSFNEEGTVQNEKVGFFPFNDYDSYYNCIHGGNAGDRNNGFKDFGPHNGAYSDKLGHYNHHFGLSMSAEFVMTPDGKYNGEDMTFSFSGDDDMWVFVDGVLVLDIGGIHNPVSGSINFRTGDVTVSGAKTVNSTGAQAGPTSLTEAFSRVAGKDWDPTPFFTHKLEVFYLERGGMYSNCKIGFNLPTYKTLSLSKRLTGLTDTERAKYTNEEFKYEVVVNDQLYNGNDTVRLNAKGEVIESGFPIVNGQVSIKDGETVTITGLHRTDTFYAAEEKSLNMDQFEVPHAERNYYDSNEIKHEQEIELTASHAQGVDLEDWRTPTYQLENTELVTFTNTLKEKNLEVDKKWEGEGTHPEEVQFTVSATIKDDDGAPQPYTVSVLKEADGTTDKKFTLSGSNNWYMMIEHLPVQTPEGKLIIYDIREVHIDGYVSRVQDLTAETYYYCNVDAVKLWPDDQHADEIITVKLQNKEGKYYAGTDAQGNAVFNETGKSFQLTKDNNYTHRFARLPYNDTYTVVESDDQDDKTEGLVTYVRTIVQFQLTNTPTGQQVDPEGSTENPVIHKRIDALRDGVPNPDSPHTDEELTDLYRLYLDYKVKSLQEADGIDMLFVIDHSGSMNSNNYGGNVYRAPSVMEALNGEDGFIAQFLDMNKDSEGNSKNRWAAVGFKGPKGGLYVLDSSFRSQYAGENDSEILSGSAGDYTWKSTSREINLPLEGNDLLPVGFFEFVRSGETVLTDYTAGFWRAEQFLLEEDVINDGRKKVIVFISDGIPTLHIEGLDQSKSLDGADMAWGSRYYPDADGGCPDQAKEQFGYFINDMKNNGYNFGENMEFYTIGFGDIMQGVTGQALLKDMLSIAYEDNKHEGNFMTIDDVNGRYYYSDAAANKLKEDLRKIMGMDETFSNIVIEDDLSNYVDLFSKVDESDLLKSAKAKVTMTEPDPNDSSKMRLITLYENGAPATSDEAKFTKENDEATPIINRLEYDPSTKTIKAVFEPEYEAAEGATYTLSFDVKATEAAYNTYAASGYDKTTDEEGVSHTIVGDEHTDFEGTDPSNSTSSGKEGFRSNDEAKATYKHNDNDEEKQYPHPVIQVFNASIEFEKVDQSMKPLVGAKFAMYKDAYDASGTEAAQTENQKNLIKANLESKLKGEEPNQIAEISLETLKPGTYYLVETETPSGYNTIEPIKIVVSVNTEVKDGNTIDRVNIKATQGDEPMTGLLEPPTGDRSYWVLKVQNNAGYELPSTGGPGQEGILAIGGLLVISAAAGLVLSRRKHLKHDR